MTPRLALFDDAAAIASEAARRIVGAGVKALWERGRFRVGLSGGRTPEGAYRALASPPWLDALDWARVALIFGDERRVPAGHPESNQRLVREALLARLPRPPSAVLAMDGADVDGDRAAKAYEEALRAELCGQGGAEAHLAAQPIDLLLLGMGADGHTASLFPGSTALAETTRWVAAVPPGSAPPPVPRLTLTPPILIQSRAILVLVTGADKARALCRALDERGDERACPIRLVHRCPGEVTFLADRATQGG